MPSLLEIIERAEQIAIGRGVDPHKSPVIDNGMTAEALYPHAVRYCIRKALAGGGNAQDYAVEQDIEIVDGVGTLPEAVMKEFMCLSYVTGEPRTSFTQYLSDYQRQRFNNLFCYYTLQGNQLHYSCDIPEEVRTLTGDPVNGTINDPTVASPTAAFVAAEAEQRLQLTDAGVVVIDGIIDSILPGNTSVLMRGGSKATTAVGAATIYDASRDAVLRSLTGVGTTIHDETVTCAGGNFTSADIGRRLRVLLGGVVIVDAIIASINSATSVELHARALSTQAAATADVMFSALKLNVPSVPATPTSATADLGISDALADDVVIAIASALVGDFKLPMLTERVK